MTEFILNDLNVKSEIKDGYSLLDFIRKISHLHGTKSGCREGDCGACTVLIGTLKDDFIEYKSIVSCLTPLINVHGKHIVTIEGLSADKLSPVQNAMNNHAATQCGFCTPGFVVSLTGHLLSSDKKEVIGSISGNICRCTGYKSIEKAAHEVDELKKTFNTGRELESLVKMNGIPDYFHSIPEKLRKIKKLESDTFNENVQIIGGGTDLMVQQADLLRSLSLNPSKISIPHNLKLKNGKITVGAGISISRFFNDPIIKSIFPYSQNYESLIASDQIRNAGSLGGNIVNASPIGDLSIFLLALNAKLLLKNSKGGVRQKRLNVFFRDYKETALQSNEWIQYIVFDTITEDNNFNFEKVSKRTYLDIASVNSAINIELEGKIIKNIHLSVGGIAPIPMYLSQTCQFLSGSHIKLITLESALDVLQNEISPIGDIRGSMEYKRLLTRQLFLQHFLKLFPDIFTEEDILKLMITNSAQDEKY